VHGSFGRDNTLNNMAAIGPDFKGDYEDPLPVSNADIAPTVMYLLVSKYSKRKIDRSRDSRGAEGRDGDGAVGESPPHVEIFQSEEPHRPARAATGATVYYDEACLIKPGATQQLKECR